ncbi:DUF2637 domain-containing protein [Saccharothrix xinjiangensis]|uniref:DUF2637 domain-containing protein n=1 Tax=Saccharothrix xinjiangensis TaxID=204798 RepID=A0ABV9XW36_9PSEU
MTTTRPTPPRLGFWERILRARAEAHAIRIRAQKTGAAEAELIRSQAAAATVTAAELAMVSEHQEWLRQRERDEAEQRAAWARTHTEDGRPIKEVSATDKGDRFWDFVLAVPLLTGSLAAMFGQIASLHPRLLPFAATELGLEGAAGTRTALGVAFAVGLTLETWALVMGRLSHKARLRGDSPAVYRAWMWAAVLFAAGINYHEWSPSWTQPSMLGVLFASLSILSVLGWELREHRADRDRRAAEIAALGWAPTPIPPRPEFGATRWVVAPRHTWTAWSVAVRERIPDANTALARADEILEARAITAGTRPPDAGWRTRLAFLLRGQAALPPGPQHSRWNVDVDDPHLPGVPTFHLVSLPGGSASAQKPPALPASRAPQPRQEVARPGDREAPEPPAQEPPAPDQQQEAPPAQEASVLPIKKAPDAHTVKDTIRRYREEHNGTLPAPNWVKENCGVGSERAKKLLAAVEDEDSQEATG